MQLSELKVGLKDTAMATIAGELDFGGETLLRRLHVDLERLEFPVAFTSLMLPFLLDTFWLGEMTNVLIWAIAGMGLMILVGQTGQASLGHSAFLAIGCYANVLLQDPNKHPLQPVIFNLVGQFNTPWNLLTAALVMAILPVVIVYVRMQKKFAAGLTLGAIK